eukprot:GILJ01001192.1.p1 GENE.GILJ01001192.1~~GILJ01001192.1.p1  ORF type:complete len:430 (+),score=58.33 GILJ01001192.1:130-1290(+)
MGEEELKPILEEFGEVQEVTVIRDRATNAHKGCAFAKFGSLTAADNCIRSLHNQRVLPGATGPLQAKYADGEAERVGVPSQADGRPVENQKLFVGSIPKQASEDDLRSTFAPYGVVEEVFIMKDPMGTPRGCAFVKLATKEQSIAAIQGLNNVVKLLGHDRPMEVRFAESKAKRVQQQPAGYGQMMGQNSLLGNPNFGGFPGAGMQPSFNARPPFPQTPSPWMEYFTPEGRPYYYNSMTGVTQWERPAEMNMPAPMGPPMGHFGGGGGGSAVSAASGPSANGPPGGNLFVFHLPNEWTENELLAHFAPFGNVISARIMIEKDTGRSRGFGFVSYDNSQSGAQAIAAMNGFSIMGKRLKVQHKKGDEGSAPGSAFPHVSPQNRYTPY